MAKFHGQIGFSEETVESEPGVWTDDIVEKEYFGDIVRNASKVQEGDKANDDITLENSISIVRDAYIGDRFLAIRYVTWLGTLWKVSKVEVQGPRLILRLGGVYNGDAA